MRNKTKSNKSKFIYDSNFRYEDVDTLVHNAKDVDNEEKFIKFLTYLWKEKKLDDDDIKKGKIKPYSSGNYGWENNTIESFLDAMLEGYEQLTMHSNNNFTDEKNIWKKIAKIIEFGKIWE